jgi:hypothetical protein
MARTKRACSLRQTYKVEYQAWLQAIHRCHNKNHRFYFNYGARGITVCDEWRDLENGFQQFLRDMGEKPSPELTLERVNNDKGYNAENCEWADRKTQQRNRRKKSKSVDFGWGSYRSSPYLMYDGEIKTLKVWATQFNINPATVRGRLYRGMSVDEALSQVNYRTINTRNGGVLRKHLLIKTGDNDNG